MGDRLGHATDALSRPEILVLVPVMIFAAWQAWFVGTLSDGNGFVEYSMFFLLGMAEPALIAWAAYIPLKLLYNWLDDREWKRTVERYSRCPVCLGPSQGVNVPCASCAGGPASHG